jgi:hypothetical protein
MVELELSRWTLIQLHEMRRYTEEEIVFKALRVSIADFGSAQGAQTEHRKFHVRLLGTMSRANRSNL